MSHYEFEIAKAENRTPLFYYPFSVKAKSDLAKVLLARHFYKQTTSYYLSFRNEHMKFFNEENMKKLSGRYTFHYDDPKETEGVRISLVKQGALKTLAKQGIDGFKHFDTDKIIHAVALTEGTDFEIIIGERVEIEQPIKLTFDDIPDLMGINEV
ncbi:hypothetical protein [Peribacillus phoenicis]|uniref:hypothetical protein n=1 Tax=unclassified Peribacillus TaxID=2675266 RepID=UPI0039A30B0A